MTPRGRRNCVTCTRWRPVSDYKPYIHRKGQYGEKENLSGQCDPCRDKRRRVQEKKRRRRKVFKENERIRSKAKREQEGVTPREFSGLKHPGARASEAELRRYGRELSAWQRRRDGVKKRKIGPKNKGEYGKTKPTNLKDHLKPKPPRKRKPKPRPKKLRQQEPLEDYIARKRARRHK